MMASRNFCLLLRLFSIGLFRTLPLVIVAIGLFWPDVALAEDAADVAVGMADELSNVPVSSTVRLLVILTALTFLPAMLLVTTPFTRFIIVFSMLRQALGLQQSPPNQVLVGMALFLLL